ncbi:MAG: dTDP-4-dehydrorhamnose reductase [Thermodesulfobacteriota bacterium]
MKVLITGAGGQLGAELVRLLDGEDIDTLALKRSELDITDSEAVMSAIENAAPDVVINSAAYTAVDKAETDAERAFAVNAQGTANLAGAASKAGALIIHISTDFVFDGKKTTPYIETDETGPKGVYASSKLKGEDEVKRLTKDYIIVRSSWIYGAKPQDRNFVKTILRLAGEREELRIVSDQIGSPTWTRDLAQAVLAFVKAKEAGSIKSGIYHFANEGEASWFELASAAIEGARRLGMELKCEKVVPISTGEYPTAAPRPAYSVLDTAKIKREMNIEIPNWRSSLNSMLEEFVGGTDA